jgi:hypothetical protein
VPQALCPGHGLEGVERQAGAQVQQGQAVDEGWLPGPSRALHQGLVVVLRVVVGACARARACVCVCVCLPACVPGCVRAWCVLGHHAPSKPQWLWPCWGCSACDGQPACCQTCATAPSSR